MTTANQIIARFMAVFGEPKTPDPDLFLAEYRKALAHYSPEVLGKAADQLMRSATFWPRPAEVIAAADKILSETQRRTDWDAIEAERKQGWEFSDLTKSARDDASRARVQAMVDGFKRNLAANKVETKDPLEIDWATVQGENSFREMQRSSPNRSLHSQPSGLTQTSRRMTGESE